VKTWLSHQGDHHARTQYTVCGAGMDHGCMVTPSGEHLRLLLVTFSHSETSTLPLVSQYQTTFIFNLQVFLYICNNTFAQLVMFLLTTYCWSP